MKKTSKTVRRAGRPQFFALCIGVLLLVLGFLPHRPAHEPTALTTPIADHAPLTSPPHVIHEPPVDCAKMPCLNLSFDDGPNPITTPQILNILEEYHVRANFFVVGLRAATMPDILQREYRNGHEIGNHSWSHPDLTTLTPAQVQAQITQTQAAVMAAGLPAPRLFRPPYGAVNQIVKSQAHMTLAMWNVDPEDWGTSDPNRLVQKVINQAKPGGVIDMHDIDNATVVALPTIIQNLKSRFQLVTMSQLLNLTPGQRGEYFGR